MRSHLITIMVAAASLEAAAQGTIASRVAQAPNGVVRLQFDGRPGVCGNGRDVVAYRNAMFARNFQSYGGWHDTKCVAGPLRVTLAVSDGRATAVTTQVGGTWPEAGSSRVTDLGTVSPTDASSYFFSLVPGLEAESGKDRLLLPAVLADDAPVIQPLLGLARNESRALNTRRQAIQWLGLLGDASIVAPLVAFARADANEDGSGKAGKKSLASSALSALSQLDGGAGVPSLIDLARTGSTAVRRDAVFWLGQCDDPRARTTLHAIIENRSEDDKVRAHAIFSLSHGGDVPASEYAWLRSSYSRLDADNIKEAVLQGMTEDGATGGRWLLERARDENESTKLRKTALFWAGQGDAAPTSEIVKVYREADVPAVREHAIFVLSQRKDDTATDALIRIAREDGDRKMRSKALFWLAQMNDPKVTKLITDMVLK